MARRIKDSAGKIIGLEMSGEEFAERVLNTEVENLSRWTKLFPKPDEYGRYLVANPEEMRLYRQRAALLNTGMTETAVANVEKEGFLDGYALLAADCPPGITVHVWRSYALIVLMQIRYGKMIGAEELAERAKINKIEDGKPVPDLEMAGRHIRLLVGIGYLQQDDSEEWRGQWRHRGLPEAWAGR